MILPLPVLRPTFACSPSMILPLPLILHLPAFMILPLPVLRPRSNLYLCPDLTFACAPSMTLPLPVLRPTFACSPSYLCLFSVHDLTSASDLTFASVRDLTLAYRCFVHDLTFACAPSMILPLSLLCP